MNNIILFENSKIMGNIPYKNYNCSILKLNSYEIKQLTNNKYYKQAILIIFFVASSHNNRYGTMSWIGVIDYDILLKLLNNENINDNPCFWIIKPHLIQNDLGPKYADLRVFKTKKNIGVIGYSRVAPKSNTPNISDYYVRASLLETKVNNNLYINSDKTFHFNEIDGGCFPSNINNNYNKFNLENDNTIINNIEFYIKNNKYSKQIKPHISKHTLMPEYIKLNGIEVSFSKTNTNISQDDHISTKNIVPLHHINYLDNIGCFIDISPQMSTNPILTVQNLNTSDVYHTDTLNVNDIYKSKNYRGSTPFIELKNNKWITLLHKRVNNIKYNYNLKYEYYIVLYNSKLIKIIDTEIIIPNECIYEIKLEDTKIFDTDFIYITGLIVNNEKYNMKSNCYDLELLISYGISDQKSGISSINIIIDLK